MKSHQFEYCELCQTDTVICGQCGNNVCNGNTGIIDGKPCDHCDEAYVLFMKGKDGIPGWNNIEKKWELLTSEEFTSLLEQIQEDLLKSYK